MPRSRDTGDANETVHGRFCAKATKDEICDAFQELSYEDKKFIKMMNEENVKKGRHYQTPLPFRSKEVHFPNNKRLGENRVVGKKRRILRDNQFAMHYIALRLHGGTFS